jgi:hypothetical protein
MLTRQKFVSSIADDLLGEPQGNTKKRKRSKQVDNHLAVDGEPKSPLRGEGPHGLSQTQAVRSVIVSQRKSKKQLPVRTACDGCNSALHAKCYR